MATDQVKILEIGKLYVAIVEAAEAYINLRDSGHWGHSSDEGKRLNLLVKEMQLVRDSANH